MAFERELEALGAIDAEARQGRMAQWRARLMVWIYRRRVQAYAACFLNEDGELSEDGLLVLGHLAREARLGRPDRNLTDGELRELVGARRIVLLLIEHLRVDPARLSRMVRQAKEQKGNDGR